MATRDAQLHEAALVFFRAARLLDIHRLHVWDERGLTLPQLRILFRIRQFPGTGMKDLAQAFGVSTSNVTQQVDKLVSRGLVSRVDRAEDRRLVSLTLTEEGDRVAGEVSHEARAYVEDLLARLSEQDLNSLTRVLTGLLELAESPESPALPAAT